MADRLGKTVNTGDVRALFGTVRNVATNLFHTDARGKDIFVPQASSVLASDLVALDTSTLLSGQVPVWTGTAFRGEAVRVYLDDWYHNIAATQWSSSLTGTGNAFTLAATSASLDTDPGEGYLALTTSTGGSSSDVATFGSAKNSNDWWSSIFRGTGTVFRFRAAVSHDSSCRHTFGIARERTAAAGATPSPSYLFDVDSGQTNIRCRHDNGAGSTGDIDSGVARSSIVSPAFKLFEIIALTGVGIAFYIDGVLVGSVTSNLPTGDNARLGPRWHTRYNGATNRLQYCDWLMVVQLTNVFSRP